MRPALVAVLALALVPGAAAAGQQPHLTKTTAIVRFLAHPKVHDWLERYPPNPETDATRDGDTWTVRVWSGKAGEIAEGKVSDASGEVLEAWTGAQVAWGMARGGEGAFGGKTINRVPVWLAFCAAFLIGLADRRVLSLRNLDLLVLLSFSASLWYFNRGDVFTAMPLVYPAFAYLLGRALWIARADRGTLSRPLWPVWVLAAGAVFLSGFRVGLNVRASNVIDVGFSGVVGADRIVHGQVPYGHMPLDVETLKPCGPADADGHVRDRIQTNGRCETANPRGDAYGPVAYLSYVPAVLAFGWSGKWDDLRAAHATAIAFDLLCLAGLALVGRRFGGNRLAATLAFAWAAYPFTQYASSSNTNDALMPAFLVWGFWLATVPAARGALAALAGWTKFAALIVAPLWLAYGAGRAAVPQNRARGTVERRGANVLRAPAGMRRFLLGSVAATLAAFSIFLLEPNPFHALHVFVDRTVVWQAGRDSPFSLWDWGQYHAKGLPNLHAVQLVLEGLLVAGAIVAPLVLARRPTPLRLAALTAALLIGFEAVLTHWFYTYIPWFFPFVAVTLLTPAAAAEPEPVLDGREIREPALVA